MEKEIWKDIPGYEGIYQVSNIGRVRGLDRRAQRNDYTIRVNGKILAQGTNRGSAGGYHFVGLNKDGEKKQVYVHRIVASAFLPNPDGLKFINHKNRNIADNRVENLEWCTAQYNVTYLDAHLKRGEKQRKAVLVYNKDGTLFGEFDCCASVAKALGMWTDTIHRYMAGKHKNRDGLTFKYKYSHYEPRK